jgi:hypothetical protein
VAEAASQLAATVPFQFTIGKTSIPRDVYEVSPLAGRGFLDSLGLSVPETREERQASERRADRRDAPILGVVR